MSEDQPSGIVYSEKQTASMAQRFSRLKPVEPGDVCCHCRQDCDGEGFSIANATAYRINGHPLCARPKCYDARMSEFSGQRGSCSCGGKTKAKD
jgi:hypothetical protein